RFWEFFAANIRNRNTRRAYYKAACRFNDWCEERGIFDLSRVRPIDVAAFVEELQRTHSKPTVKQNLAALRMLFDWRMRKAAARDDSCEWDARPQHCVLLAWDWDIGRCPATAGLALRSFHARVAL